MDKLAQVWVDSPDDMEIDLLDEKAEIIGKAEDWKREAILAVHNATKQCTDEELIEIIDAVKERRCRLEEVRLLANALPHDIRQEAAGFFL